VLTPLSLYFRHMAEQELIPSDAACENSLGFLVEEYRSLIWKSISYITSTDIVEVLNARLSTVPT
jgi:hypothetical protein